MKEVSYGTDGNFLMLRIATNQFNARKLTTTVSKALDVPLQTNITENSHSALSVASDPASTPISRYIPSSGKSFLVEEHRLTDSEKTTQKVSAVIPWLVFGAFAITPFFVMKYNLQRLSGEASVPTGPSKNIPMNSARYKFGVYTQHEVPELLARRSPTLVCLVSGNYHSQVMSKLFEEIDRFFEAFGIKINVALVHLDDTADPKFRQLAPHCQFFTTQKGDSSIYSYEGPWNVDNIIRFVLPESKITQPMFRSIKESEDRITQIQQTLFKRQFIDTK